VLIPHSSLAPSLKTEQVHSTSFDADEPAQDNFSQWNELSVTANTLREGLSLLHWQLQNGIEALASRQQRNTTARHYHYVYHTRNDLPSSL
jgi:hypothetical protein